MRRGLETAVDLIELGIESGNAWEFGVVQFDSLTPEQQLGLLAEIGRALFYKSVRVPDLTATNEAGVYVIFRALMAAIEFEINDGEVHDISTRQLVHDFISTEMADDDEEMCVPISPDCNDIQQWQFEIECIADKILWDRDFELDDLIVDCSPEKAMFMESHLGIADDYFTSIASEPNDLAKVRKTLQQLLRAKPR